MKAAKGFMLFLCAALALTFVPLSACAPAEQPAPTPVLTKQPTPTPEPAAPGTYVDQDITSDTTWPADDYYICMTDGGRAPQIKNGAALIIESGARLYFSADGAAIPGGKRPAPEISLIDGALTADGVTFTTVPGREDAGWNGVKACGGALALTNCVFGGGSAYPVEIGGSACLNEGISDAGNGFMEGYPDDCRYIAVAQDISGSAVWGDAGMPYLLTDEISIRAEDGSLRILPGVSVCLEDRNFNIQGSLLAEGLPDAPVVFLRKPGAKTAGELYAGEGFTGSIVLHHCLLDGLNRGLHVESAAAEGSSVTLENCTIINPAFGIRFADTAKPVVLRNCSIIAGADSAEDGVALDKALFVTLQNCLVAGFPRYGVVIHDNMAAAAEEGAPLMENCTVAHNGRVGLMLTTSGEGAYGAIVRNSILAQNALLDLARGYSPDGEVRMEKGSIAYSLVGYYDNLFTGRPALYSDEDSGDVYALISRSAYSKCLNKDPLFAEVAAGAADYHLKSAAGRWNGQEWVIDDATSPGVDAGDPGADYSSEPEPNGGRVNIGCYGNTEEASKSSPKPQWSGGGSSGGDSGGGGISYE